MQPFWRLERGDGPLVAVAIHNGHELRDELRRWIALDDASRLREEDPYTGEWSKAIAPRMIVLRSRFEVDLNRPRERAVSQRPEDVWGLHLWKGPLPEEIVERSLAEYDAFYAALHELLAGVERQHGRFVVFDLHNYNHRRDGPQAPPMSATENPQVNLGTGTMDRRRWAPVVDRFMADLRSYDFPGGRLDVRENVRFRGGHLSRWIHQTFPETGCTLAIEFKKFFMNEWTGRADEDLVRAITSALRHTAGGVLEELGRL